MSILLLSTGGGGGNILRSLKTLFDHDVEITRQTDPEYAARLRSAITTRFLDTNEFSLSDLPLEEQLLIGTRTYRVRIGARGLARGTYRLRLRAGGATAILKARRL